MGLKNRKQLGYGPKHELSQRSLANIFLFSWCEFFGWVKTPSIASIALQPNWHGFGCIFSLITVTKFVIAPFLG
jgi:hypothetical protein